MRLWRVDVKRRILVIGQCTLHWGRMEFGNIGNFYIIDPFFNELRRVFPDSEIATTMQFSDEFCKKYNIETLPMEIYYDFMRSDNLENAVGELNAVIHGNDIDSRYVDEIKKADLVIDFSGDIWGDNADFLGGDRFATGCYKDLIAQHLKPTVMVAGSPGPFKNPETLELAKRVYNGFDLVTNREPISTRLLEEQGFNLSKTQNYPCPSFLFEKAGFEEVKKVVQNDILFSEDDIKVGIIMCGWNFERGPFDAWPRDDSEYEKIVNMACKLMDNRDVHVFLISHANGFDIPPKPFVLKHGRDFPIMKQMKRIFDESGYGKSVTLLEGVYSPEITKGIVSNLDILISGRMHGAVAGISQSIPTMIIDYGHEPKAHKLRGFAEVSGIENFIANPNNEIELIDTSFRCYNNRKQIRNMLQERMVDVKNAAKKQFDLLGDLI